MSDGIWENTPVCVLHVLHPSSLTKMNSRARHRKRGEHQHGHGQDYTKQARHDVEARHSRRIVAAVLTDLEGRHRLDGLGSRGRAPAPC